jgi:hypothetical protein
MELEAGIPALIPLEVPMTALLNKPDPITNRQFAYLRGLAARREIDGLSPQRAVELVDQQASGYTRDQARQAISFALRLPVREVRN